MTGEPRYVISGETGDWEVIVGLEVHAQVASKSKLFSGASAEYGGAPNTHVSLVDAAMPGMLPVINTFCIEQAVRTGLGLKAEINLKSRFDRKNYFYPDLPQGYQISQYKDPIVGEGEVEVELDDGETITVGIERLHLEQDAGKSIHDLDPKATYVDLNRSGVALMEIVSKPHMRSPAQAAAYVRKLRAIVRYLGTCDGNMEQGSMRADVNVSVCRPGAYEAFRESGDFKHLGTRCEIKNVNSQRFVAMAVETEARRQVKILEDGGTIDQETRLFDVAKGETRAMRSKEEAHDYRYFPDPDLLPLELDPKWVEDIKASLPELPDDKRARFVETLGLSAYDAGVLTADKDRADYYEAMLADGADAKAAANWLINEHLGRVNKEGVELGAAPVNAQANAAIVQAVSSELISGKIAKDVYDGIWVANTGGDTSTIIDTGEKVRAYIKKNELEQVTDTGAIETIVDDIIAANPDQAAKVKDKPKTMGWFVGQVMQASGGRANPKAVNEILRKKLGL